MLSFRVVDSASAPSNGNEVLLGRDNWNDWFIWVTQFHVIVVSFHYARMSFSSQLWIDAFIRCTVARRIGYAAAR